MSKSVEDEKEELRELIRDMHAAIKDGNRLLKALETTKEELMAVSDQVFDEKMRESVEKGLDQYDKSMKEAIGAAEDAVYERFASLGEVLLKGPGDGLTLEEMAGRIAEYMRQDKPR